MITILIISKFTHREDVRKPTREWALQGLFGGTGVAKLDKGQEIDGREGRGPRWPLPGAPARREEDVTGTVFNRRETAARRRVGGQHAPDQAALRLLFRLRAEEIVHGHVESRCQPVKGDQGRVDLA